MINFYKENGIGKIAFASGQVIAPSGRISIFVDDSTNQLVIAEDGEDKFWIQTVGQLQVNGSNITGTNEEKAALIAPVFQNSNPVGTGGGKFGIEDTFTETGVYRAVDLNKNGINIFNANEILLDAADGSKLAGYDAILSSYSEGGINQPYTDLYNQNSAGQQIALYLFDNSFKYKRDGVRNFLPLSASANGGAKVFADSTGNIDLIVGAASAPKLLSPDGTTWTLSISNEGAILATSGGTGGTANFTLTSPDNSVWAIAISNEGVLSQTKP